MFLVHPDQSGQVGGMVERYRSMVQSGGGTMHRLENLGLRPLAYPISKVHKAHYVLMNIETTSEVVGEIKSSFQFNDAVVRNMIVRCDDAVTGPSPLMRSARQEEQRAAEARARAEGAPERAAETPAKGDAASGQSAGTSAQKDAAPAQAAETSAQSDAAPAQATAGTPAQSDTTPAQATTETSAQSDATPAQPATETPAQDNTTPEQSAAETSPDTTANAAATADTTTTAGADTTATPAEPAKEPAKGEN